MRTHIIEEAKSGNPKRLYELAAHGLSDENIEHYLGIDAGMLAVWQFHKAEIREAIARGRADRAMAVHQALTRKATGTDKKVTKVYRYEDGERVLVEEKEETLPVDMKALEMVLVNQHGNQWKATGKVEVSVGMGDVEIDKRLKRIIDAVDSDRRSAQ
jgi:hypothetical protein